MILALLLATLLTHTRGAALAEPIADLALAPKAHVPALYLEIKASHNISAQLDECMRTLWSPLHRVSMELVDTRAPDLQIYKYAGEFPSTPWIRDALLVRTRANLMQSHHTHAGHAELEAAGAPALEYTWVRPARPHILFLMSDDQGYYDAGWHAQSAFLGGQGESNPSPTPGFDALRAESVELMYLYTYPICSPSRAGIMSGRFTHRHGYGPSINNGWSNQFPGRETVWPEILKGAGGYYNMGVEKWHLGLNDKRNRPLFRGFDSYLGHFSLDYKSRDTSMTLNQYPFLNVEFTVTQAQGASLLNATQSEERDTWEGVDEAAVPVHSPTAMPGIATTHHVNIIRHEQGRMLDAFVRSPSRRKPLMFYMSSRLPHDPVDDFPDGFTYPAFSTARRWNSATNRRNYLRMLFAMDVQMEELRAHFARVGFWKDTVMIFLSDNTGLANGVGESRNDPLQGRKNLIWDQRVLNMFHGTASTLRPLDAAAWGTENYDLAHGVDLFPTILTGIAGIPPEDYKYAWKCADCVPFHDNEIDGVNLWDSIRTPGGLAHIATSTRMFATHVITQQQIELQNADIETVHRILPTHAYAPSFWSQSNYSSEFSRITRSDIDLVTAVREVAVGWGGGYVQAGRYSLFFVDRNALTGDPSLNPAKRAKLLGSVQTHADISQILTEYDDLPAYIPGHPENLAYMHDVWADQERRTNLISPTMSTAQKDALAQMLRHYMWEQDVNRSLIDSKLLYMWSNDPAMARKYAETGKVGSFCDLSDICTHDMPIVLSRGRVHVDWSLAPTPAPYPFYTAPTMRPTAAPTVAPTQRPTQGPTAAPTAAPTLRARTAPLPAVAVGVAIGATALVCAIIVYAAFGRSRVSYALASRMGFVEHGEDEED